MLNNISWQGYWTTLALLTVAYYFFLYLRYFRSDVKAYLQRQKPATATPTAMPSVATFLKEQVQPSLFPYEEDDEFATPADTTVQAVYACMDELTAYFESAKKAKVMKAEVTYALQRILQKYPALQTSDYKESILKIIQTEAKHHCSIHLSDEEISKVWMMT